MNPPLPRLIHGITNSQLFFQGGEGGGAAQRLKAEVKSNIAIDIELRKEPSVTEIEKYQNRSRS